MPHRIEITLKEALSDAEGMSLRNKAKNYFDIELEDVRTVQIVTIDADLTKAQVETVRKEVFTNPVTQVSSLTPLQVDFDWILWIGFRPGVRDNPGATGVEAMLAKRVMVRSGFRSDPREASLGLGITAGAVSVDIATSFNLLLGSTHEVGITIVRR